ncbi:MAG: trehalose-phosphatase [Nitrospinae bacterium]|nr:trehalose-phosphatase [Nitrospinota bacterium]
MSPPVHLWGSLTAVLQRLMAHAWCALLLDYDGTLTPIVANPAEARLSPAMRRVLTALARHPRYRVAIVSGRALADLRGRVDIEAAWLAGNHGLEIEGPRTAYRHPGALRFRPAIEALARTLQSALREMPGALVEDKGLTLTIHTRRTPAALLPTVKRLVFRLVRPAIDAGLLTLRTGKAAWEVRPRVTWDKGKAVRWIAERVRMEMPEANGLAVYIGDDDTDEDAFRALGSAGIGIVVGDDRSTSAAHYYVESVEQTAQFLGLLRARAWPKARGAASSLSPWERARMRALPSDSRAALLPSPRPSHTGRGGVILGPMGSPGEVGTSLQAVETHYP